MAAQIRFNTNNLGFRGPELEIPKPIDEYRIFMVGGSTTECLLLDDTTEIAWRLSEHLNRFVPNDLNIKVYNAGKSGDRSYDHIAMISQRIMHLQPDMIILFAGLNDLMAAIHNADYLHRPQTSEIYLSRGKLIKYSLTEFQLPRRLYNLYKSLAGQPTEEELFTQISFTSHYREMVEACRKHPISNELPRVDLLPFQRNLQTIIGIVKAHNCRLILMTQASTWNSPDSAVTDWHWMTYRNGVRYREANLVAALKKYNDVTRKLALENSILCFDLIDAIPKTVDFFYDDCHFNRGGARRAAELLGQFLLQNNLVE